MHPDRHKTNRIFEIFIALFILFGFYSCKKPVVKQIPSVFKMVQVNISLNGVTPIKNCALWYNDFSDFKRVVVFKNDIICVGYMGGFLCLKSNNFQRDTILESRMNTDFFTNIAVFHDTLFSEKFDQLYFWAIDHWQSYLHPLPIKYFDLLQEDSNYVFYYSYGGEFGSILFVYNKQSRTTKAQFTDMPNSVIKIDSGYFVGVYLNMTNFSASYILKDVEKLKPIDPALRNVETMFDRDTNFYGIIDSSIAARNNVIPYEYKYSQIVPQYRIRKEGGKIDTLDKGEIMIIGSFRRKNQIYHIIDPGRITLSPVRLIGSIRNDSLLVIDSLPNCLYRLVYQFGETSIINQSEGFTMVRNDTIFNLNFTTMHHGYNGPGFEGYALNTDSTKKPSARAQFVDNFNVYKDIDSPLVMPGQAMDEIKFQFGSKYRFEAYNGGQHPDVSYLFINGVRHKLRFQSWPTFFREMFTYDNRLFILFQGLGLVEITDINRFVKAYEIAR